MRFALISLKAIHNNGVSARIPHQSAARTSLADSFSPGEAKAAYGGNRAINDNLKYTSNKKEPSRNRDGSVFLDQQQ
jgi:hypothetical protein